MPRHSAGQPMMSNSKIRSFAPAWSAVAGPQGLRCRLQHRVLLLCLWCMPWLGFAAAPGALVAQNGAKAAEASARDAAKPAAAAKPVVGVVDIDKAVEFYPKAIAERERLQALNKSFVERMDAITKQIDQVRADMMLEKEGSDQREWKQLEYGELQKRREVLKALLTRQFDREQQKGLITIYEDVEAAIAEVAKRRGVQIVLRHTPTLGPEDLVKDPSSAQRQRLIQYDTRLVWFASEEFDLTPAVINFLKVPAAAPAAVPAGPGGPGGARDGGERK